MENKMEAKIYKITRIEGEYAYLSDESGEELGQLIIDNIYRIMRAIGIKSQKELGFPREKVIAMAEEVVANHLTGHAPIPVTLEMARELLAYSYDDYQ